MPEDPSVTEKATQMSLHWKRVKRAAAALAQTLELRNGLISYERELVEDNAFVETNGVCSPKLGEKGGKILVRRKRGGAQEKSSGTGKDQEIDRDL